MGLLLQRIDNTISFSALGRAVGDETGDERPTRQITRRFSALGRAVGDETAGARRSRDARIAFQCSRSSRGG